MEKFLIVDVHLVGKVVSKLSDFGPTVLTSGSMTEQLIAFDIWNLLPRARTLLVFPGRGAETLKEELPSSWLGKWRWTKIYAKRNWQPGQSPQVVVGHIFPDGLHLELTDIVIVDDVVSSGLTCRKIMAVNSPWIPRARWHIATWVMQRATSLRGFKTIRAACCVGTNETKTSVQSLSTLLSDQEIASGYAEKHVVDKNRFLDFLEELRTALGAR